MARRFDAPRLIVASHNPGKVGEIAALLAALDIAVASAAELGLVAPEETGATFAANARLKAAAAASAAGAPALADDSGLVVEALDGAPGNLLGAMGGSRWRFHRRHGASRARA